MRTISATWTSRLPDRSRRNLAADGHQDHLDHAGDHEDRAGTGEGRCHPWRDGEGLTSAREGLADSAPKITTCSGRQDPRHHRPWRQDHPRDLRDHRREIDIDDDGTVKVAAVTGASGEAAVARIKDIVAEAGAWRDLQRHRREDRRFRRLRQFPRAKDGLVHISELQNGRTEGRPTSARKATRSRSRSSGSTTAARSSCR